MSTVSSLPPRSRERSIVRTGNDTPATIPLTTDAHSVLLSTSNSTTTVQQNPTTQGTSSGSSNSGTNTTNSSTVGTSSLSATATSKVPYPLHPSVSRQTSNTSLHGGTATNIPSLLRSTGNSSTTLAGLEKNMLSLSNNPSLSLSTPTSAGYVRRPVNDNDHSGRTSTATNNNDNMDDITDNVHSKISRTMSNTNENYLRYGMDLPNSRRRSRGSSIASSENLSIILRNAEQNSTGVISGIRPMTTTIIPPPSAQIASQLPIGSSDIMSSINGTSSMTGFPIRKTTSFRSPLLNTTNNNNNIISSNSISSGSTFVGTMKVNSPAFESRPRGNTIGMNNIAKNPSVDAINRGNTYNAGTLPAVMGASSLPTPVANSATPVNYSADNIMNTNNSGKNDPSNNGNNDNTSSNSTGGTAIENRIAARTAQSNNRKLIRWYERLWVFFAYFMLDWRFLSACIVAVIGIIFFLHFPDLEFWQNPVHRWAWLVATLLVSIFPLRGIENGIFYLLRNAAVTHFMQEIVDFMNSARGHLANIGVIVMALLLKYVVFQLTFTEDGTFYFDRTCIALIVAQVGVIIKNIVLKLVLRQLYEIKHAKAVADVIFYEETARGLTSRPLPVYENHAIEDARAAIPTITQHFRDSGLTNLVEDIFRHRDDNVANDVANPKAKTLSTTSLILKKASGIIDQALVLIELPVDIADPDQLIRRTFTPTNLLDMEGFWQRAGYVRESSFTSYDPDGYVVWVETLEGMQALAEKAYHRLSARRIYRMRWRRRILREMLRRGELIPLPIFHDKETLSMMNDNCMNGFVPKENNHSHHESLGLGAVRALLSEIPVFHSLAQSANGRNNSTDANIASYLNNNAVNGILVPDEAYNMEHIEAVATVDDATIDISMIDTPTVGNPLPKKGLVSLDDAVAPSSRNLLAVTATKLSSVSKRNLDTTVELSNSKEENIPNNKKDDADNDALPEEYKDELYNEEDEEILYPDEEEDEEEDREVLEEFENSSPIDKEDENLLHKNSSHNNNNNTGTGRMNSGKNIDETIINRQSSRLSFRSSVLKSVPKGLSRSDIASCFTNTQDLDAAWSLLDMDGSGYISKSEFVSCFSLMFNAWNSTRTNLQSYGAISNAIKMLAGSIYWFAMLLIVLAIYGVNFTNVLVSMGTLLVSLSFAVGGIIQRLLDSLLFVLVIQPFDVGDRVSISTINTGSTLIVNQINVLTTEFTETCTGKRITVRNSDIISSNITNLRRSGNVTFSPSFIVDHRITGVQLKELENRVCTFIRSEKNQIDWKPDVSLSISHSEANKVQVTFWLTTRASWHEPFKTSPAQSRLTIAIVEIFRDMGIAYSSPVARLAVENMPDIHLGRIISPVNTKVSSKGFVRRPTNLPNTKLSSSKYIKKNIGGDTTTGISSDEENNENSADSNKPISTAKNSTNNTVTNNNSTNESRGTMLDSVTTGRKLARVLTRHMEHLFSNSRLMEGTIAEADNEDDDDDEDDEQEKDDESNEEHEEYLLMTKKGSALRQRRTGTGEGSPIVGKKTSGAGAQPTK